MKAPKLRKVFRLDTEGVGEEDSDSDLPLDLDEEEQDKFIDRLQAQDKAQNELYKRTLLGIIALSIIPFPFAMYHGDTTMVNLGLLSICSLLSTAYILAFVPNSSPGDFSMKQQLGFPSTRSPLETCLIPLNEASSLLIAAYYYLLRHRKGAQVTSELMFLLPLGR